MTQIRAEEGEETSQRGEVAETFPISEREEVVKVRKVKVIAGQTGFCFAGDALPLGESRMRKEARTAVFSSQGNRQNFFISLIKMRDCCFCQILFP